MLFNIVQIIDKKSKGLSLSKEEINFFVNGAVSKEIPDYQLSSLLMAIKLKGLTDQEVIDYARALVDSGEVLPLNEELVDKHSSGGVGDKTSISLLPILGAMGLKVFKMSGRGLGFTGGTVDKLESMKGFNCELTIEQVYEMVEDINISITGQTPKLTPADGLLYALRDVTATVDSQPLIAASIISKKIASGAKNILIDMKVGSGAFTDNLEEAEELARLMKLIANDWGRNLYVLFSSMDQPLGLTAGNKIEVEEAVEALKGNWAPDFYELIKKISVELYSKSKNTSTEEAERVFEEVISSGKALELQKQWFAKHGASDFENETVLKAEHKVVFNSRQEGYVSFNDVKNIGNALIEIKAGRKSKGEALDFDSGIKFLKKTGELVKVGEPLFEVTSSNEIKEEVIELILSNYNFDKEPKESKVILGGVTW